MPKKASMYKLVRKKTTGTMKGKLKKAPVTKERELTKSLIETLKKEAKSKGVTLKSLLTEKEIKILTERARNKAFETVGKKVNVSSAHKVMETILGAHENSYEFKSKSFVNFFNDNVKLNVKKNMLWFRLRGYPKSLFFLKKK